MTVTGNGSKPKGLKLKSKSKQLKAERSAAQAAEPKKPIATPALPVDEAQQKIVDMVKKNPSIVVVGETGSGKTTKIPQFVLDEYVNKLPAEEQGMVACTQPRRVAAVSIAKYVAQCRGCNVGGEVAYSVRFDDRCTKNTKLRFMTDGILLREILNDPLLKKYSCVILDEAHERTLHGDVLFGLLKNLQRERNDLKIVVMSATLNAQHFSKFWRNAPIGIVRGRTFPVTIMHTQEPQNDYVDAAINTIMQIHMQEDPGDILCFLTGQEEIEDCKNVLEERLKYCPEDMKLQLKVLTLYSAMPYEQQMIVFEKAALNERKIILATNIAETSITIEGIKYVVDAGFVKVKEYDPKTQLDSLKPIPESKAQARQRTGRAGRMTSGKCYRLYTEELFENLIEDTTPEILRCSLSSIVLQMKAMGINDVENFEFMDMPNRNAIIGATIQLIGLGALDRETGRITKLGRRMIEFPVDPMAAKALMAGQTMGCATEVAAIIAMLTTENIFIGSKANRDAADRARGQFMKSTGDHISLLNLYQTYMRQGKANRRDWCESNCISHRQMEKVEDTYKQLVDILSTFSSPLSLDELRNGGGLTEEEQIAEMRGEEYFKGGSGAAASTLVGKKHKRTEDGGEEGMDGEILDDPRDERRGRRHEHSATDHEDIRKAISYGFFANIAYYHVQEGSYKSIATNQQLKLHPTSFLHGLKKKPPMVLYNNVVQTNAKYMKEVTVIREEWLVEVAPLTYGRRE